MEQIIQHQLARIEARFDAGIAGLYDRLNQNHTQAEARIRALEDKNLVRDAEEKVTKRYLGFVATGCGALGSVAMYVIKHYFFGGQ